MSLAFILCGMESDCWVNAGDGSDLILLFIKLPYTVGCKGQKQERGEDLTQ